VTDRAVLNSQAQVGMARALRIVTRSWNGAELINYAIGGDSYAQPQGPATMLSKRGQCRSEFGMSDALRVGPSSSSARLPATCQGAAAHRCWLLALCGTL